MQNAHAHAATFPPNEGRKLQILTALLDILDMEGSGLLLSEILRQLRRRQICGKRDLGQEALEQLLNTFARETSLIEVQRPERNGIKVTVVKLKAGVTRSQWDESVAPLTADAIAMLSHAPSHESEGNITSDNASEATFFTSRWLPRDLGI